MENIDIYEIYHFLFETIPGIGVLVGAGLVISILICFILEAKTRKRFRDHEVEDDVDEWSIFEEGVEEGIAEEEAKEAEER